MTLLKPESALAGLQENIRKELLSEFSGIQTAFYASRWRDCGLAAGRFCEVAYTIICDLSKGTQSETASKPRDFGGSCRKLESNTLLPDGLRIHAMKLLPVLYDIRNKRDVGHVNDEIDPSQMDANLCMMGASWILAELVRTMHDLPTATAEKVVRSIVEVKSPVIWDGGDVRRLAVKGLSRADEVLLLVSSNQGCTSEDDLLNWMEIRQRSNLRRVLNTLHAERYLESKTDLNNLRLLPRGMKRAQEIFSELGS
ncbi:hypothetical protein LCM19_03165 [Qipengyuania flava]|nr:hypothetical protein [Qipengyuania flava]